MSDLHNVQQMLEEAKRAAGAGELAAAVALLQDVARIQEAELGPLHPELANTINNLGVVAEMEGRFHDAETHYRRAVAITSASLPPDDPVVASSRKNLEDFCREHGLPFDSALVVPSIPQQPSDEVANTRALSDAKPPADVRMADTDVAPPAGAKSRSLALVAIALVVVVAVVILFARSRSSRESPAPPQAGEPAAPPAVEPVPPRPTAPAPAPIERPQPPSGASRDTRSGAEVSPSTPAASAGGITLVTAQLCRTFSVGNNWQCDPAGESVAPGPIVLYTRVKSAGDAVVIHRWYRGDTLRKTARLTILSNTTDGYRTYSRQTVNRGEDWRVEVRTAAGDVLYEQRVSVH